MFPHAKFNVRVECITQASPRFSEVEFSEEMNDEFEFLYIRGELV